MAVAPPSSTTTTSPVDPPALDWDASDEQEQLFFRDLGFESLASIDWGNLGPEDDEGWLEVDLYQTLLSAGYVTAFLDTSPEVKDFFLDAVESGGRGGLADELEKAATHLDLRWAEGAIGNCFEGDPLIYLNEDWMGIGMPEGFEHTASDFDSQFDLITYCVYSTVRTNQNAAWIEDLSDKYDL